MTVLINRPKFPPPRHPELVSGSKVQKATDSERSEHSSFAQGENRAKY
ncbi:hypothetical protein [Pseudoalteromonas sp. Of7M-16]|nr:hypothetical protein [Pseudoalteromonas sp. Of7M-16]MCG7551795.1 hypothetical protein [Pseudoalteromonas sp. Of7M-16]